jgi:hypothetical protein
MAPTVAVHGQIRSTDNGLALKLKTETRYNFPVADRRLSNFAGAALFFARRNKA